MRAPHLVAAVLTAGLLTACGGEDDSRASGAESTRNEPAPSSPEPPSSEPATPASPADETTLPQAARRLLRSDTGFFYTTIDLGPGGTIEREGGFQRRPRASFSETLFDYPDSDPLVVATISVGARTWVRPESTAAGPSCWVESDPAVVSQTLGLDVVGSPSGFPAEVLAVLNARGGRTAGAPVLGDVYSIASLVTGKFTAALDLDDPAAFAPMPIEVELGNGEVRGIRTSVADIATAARRAGADPAPEIGELTAAGVGEIEVVIDGGADSPRIEPPPASEIVSMSEDTEQFEADARACADRLG